jgi:hypothetical protein
MGPASIWAERNLTEPTGFESSVTNFLSLPFHLWHTVSQGSAPARLRRNRLREALLLLRSSSGGQDQEREPLASPLQPGRLCSAGFWTRSRLCATWLRSRGSHLKPSGASFAVFPRRGEAHVSDTSQMTSSSRSDYFPILSQFTNTSLVQALSIHHKSWMCFLLV